MFERIKNFLFLNNKDSKDNLTENNIFPEEVDYDSYNCEECENKELCKAKKLILINRNISDTRGCAFNKELEYYEEGKDTFFIIDDNEGIVSFLEDDLDFFNDEGIINLDDINVLALSGNLSGFSYEMIQKKIPNLNIKWAVIDITLGGSIMTDKGNMTTLKCFN